jgi:GNAT superfamily N-acetyltransferase
MYFDAAYYERALLADGRPVELRLIRPDDKERLRRGFERLSAESRYRRFFTPKPSLSPTELAYLTEVDQVDHVALGALDGAREHDGDEGLGVARFVRLAERPDTAEAAIAVADEVQGRGLGRLLFQRLCAAAAERGIERLRCEMLALNQPMRGLVDALVPEVMHERDGQTVVVEFTLPRVPPDQGADAAPRANPVYRLLVMTAEGMVQMGRMFDRWIGKSDA